MIVNCNLIEDLNEVIRKKLEKNKIKFDRNKDIIIQYLNFVNKIIEQKPRRVAINKEFKNPFKFNRIINEIKLKLEQGQNVNLYLSKKINDASYNDKMLNYYKIYHFHLGDGIEKGFRKRSKELLYVFIDEEDACILGIFNHGQWGMEFFLKIIDNNWPYKLDNTTMKGISSVSNIEQKDIENSMNNNQVYMQQVRNRVCLPPGLGVMSSGDSIKIVEERNFLYSSLEEAEKDIENNTVSKLSDKDYEEIKTKMSDLGMEKLNFKVIDMIGYELILYNENINIKLSYII